MKKRALKYFDYSYDHDGELGLIPPTLGEGVKWVHERDKHRFCTTLEPYHFHGGKGFPTKKSTKKRILHLKESTWAGIGLGAMHYYARLEAQAPNVRDLTAKRGGFGGYVGMPEKHPMKYSIGTFSLDAKRRLTKVEKDMSGEVLGKIGDWTPRFNTPKEAREAVIATFKKRFAPGWVLLGHDDNGDEIVLAET